MSSRRIDELCRHHGIALGYHQPDGSFRRVPDATKRLILAGLHVDPNRPPEGPPAPQEMRAPTETACFVPDSLSQFPGWGIFCQLYELRSDRNWGIGDFADLADLAVTCGRAGVDFLGINPVHALFGADPQRRSPFSPSNRQFLNPLYIAVDRLPGFDGEPADVPRLRSTDLVDYPKVAECKFASLKRIFKTSPFGSDPFDEKAFQSFVRDGGEPLRRHALFETVSAAMVKAGHGAGWQDWPDAFQDPETDEARQFAEASADDVRFHLWLQWIARVQLAAAQSAARDAGMRIGLYLDLAVGEAPDGSATWGASATLPGLVIGAPPDVFATDGQNWQLAAPSPAALRAADFAPFRDMIAAQLRDAGALRIDHAMALWQLFLIPEGGEPADGAHLRYPMTDMVQVLAELSQESKAVVIGEDLGYVPDGFRQAMENAQILSYRILYFEQADGRFHPPEDYPAMALACLSTHDLPVLSAWWTADDVALRHRHGLVDDARTGADKTARLNERRGLVRALEAAGLAPETIDATASALPDGLLAAAYQFVARTSCRLAGVRLADLVGPSEPTNLPGTTDEYPNWRPRSPVAVPDIAEHPHFRDVTAMMRTERPRPGKRAERSAP